MKNDELINAIINEVKKVLTERGIPVSKGNATTNRQPAFKNRVPAAPAVSAGNASSVGGSDLTGRQIITQKYLESFQGKTVSVTPKAVITPLAKDYAKEKGITIVKVEASPATKTTGSAGHDVVTVALLIASDFRGDKGIVRTILGNKGFRINEISATSYEDAVKKVSAAVDTGTAHFGVCIENTGMEAPIHANRNPKIRAVHCRATFDARSARIDYGANLIVIDSTSDPDAVISGFCGM